MSYTSQCIISILNRFFLTIAAESSYVEQLGLIYKCSYMIMFDENQTHFTRLIDREVCLTTPRWQKISRCNVLGSFPYYSPFLLSHSSDLFEASIEI